MRATPESPGPRWPRAGRHAAGLRRTLGNSPAVRPPTPSTVGQPCPRLVCAASWSCHGRNHDGPGRSSSCIPGFGQVQGVGTCRTKGAPPVRLKQEEPADPLAPTQAFESFYLRHFEAITRFVARRVADPHAVADLTAEIFLVAPHSRHTYRPGRGSETGWLYRVARNVLSAERRRSEREARAVVAAAVRATAGGAP
ncbi:sigma factor [Nonomuraea sp. NPDC046802]|uniref:RNA polymerase sigma factor n=1 Tax=Nonomuraea sp. NPDC046802 TaxID=3154919 RepID=UPI00340E1BB0